MAMSKLMDYAFFQAFHDLVARVDLLEEALLGDDEEDDDKEETAS